MDKNFVSIIVPAYNCSTTIQRTIQCLINQEYQNYEIIIIDDGSTDNTADICKKYLDNKRLKYFFKENGGVSSARNLGIQYARGNYITFVDSDDYISSDFLKILTSSINDKCTQLIITNIQKVKQIKDIDLIQKEIMNSIKIIRKEALNKEIPNLLEKEYLNYLHGKLYDKNLILEYNISFPEEISLGEDTLFNFQYITKCEEVIMNPQTVYFYVQSENIPSLSTKFDKNLFQNLYNLNKDILLILHENDFEIRNFESVFNNRLIIASIASLKSINKPDCNLKLSMQYRHIIEIKNKCRNINLKIDKPPKNVNNIYIYILNIKSNLLAFLLLKLIKIIKK